MLTRRFLLLLLLLRPSCCGMLPTSYWVEGFVCRRLCVLAADNAAAFVVSEPSVISSSCTYVEFELILSPPPHSPVDHSQGESHFN